MRTGMFTIAALVVVSSAAGQESKSALESDPTGWVDILPGKDLAGWKRVPLGSKLADKNPWKVDAESKVLVCDGVGVHEAFHYDKELGDFIYHIEWRFKKLEDGKGYNSGVYARNSADAKVWHQAQVGSKNVGFIFGNTLVDGKQQRMPRVGQTTPQYGKEAGEWNTYEITCKGKNMNLWVNGHVTGEWTDCQVPRGYIGVEAEGFVIEFRNIKVKELK